MGKKQNQGLFKEDFVMIAHRACAMYYSTDAELAVLFGVREQTIRAWQEKYRGFENMVRHGRYAYAFEHQDDDRVDPEDIETAISRKNQAGKLNDNLGLGNKTENAEKTQKTD